MTYDEFLNTIKQDFQKQYNSQMAEQQFKFMLEFLKELDYDKKWEQGEFSFENLKYKLKFFDFNNKWLKFTKQISEHDDILIDGYKVKLKTIRKTKKPYEFLILEKDNPYIDFRKRVILMKDEIFRYCINGWDKEDVLKDLKDKIVGRVLENKTQEERLPNLNIDFDRPEFSNEKVQDILVRREIRLKRDNIEFNNDIDYINQLIDERACLKMIAKYLQAM